MLVPAQLGSDWQKWILKVLCVCMSQHLCLLRIILLRIGSRGLCPSAKWDFLEARHRMDRKKKNRVCLAADQQETEIKSSAWDALCVCVCVCSWIWNALYQTKSLACLYFTCTRPQASLSFPRRFDIQKKYCPNKPLIFIIIVTRLDKREALLVWGPNEPPSAFSGLRLC